MRSLRLCRSFSQRLHQRSESLWYVFNTQPVLLQAGRFLHIHLPPKRLWSWLCDGPAVYDALIIAVWIALNVFYVQQRYALLYPSFTGTLLGPPPAPLKRRDETVPHCARQVFGSNRAFCDPTRSLLILRDA